MERAPEKPSAYFQYDEPARKLIYTTNAVEGFYWQMRKTPKTESAFRWLYGPDETELPSRCQNLLKMDAAVAKMGISYSATAHQIWIPSENQFVIC